MLVLAALPIGAGAAWSTNEWLEGADRGQAEIEQLRRELLGSAGLMELHNAVYTQVGAETWENQVKPQFLSAITYATIRETGNILPEGRHIIEWVRNHPEEARRLMKEAAGLP